MTNSTASGSSPFTWKIGACTIFATSVQYSVERASSRRLVVKPTWLLSTMWIVPPVQKPRVCDIWKVSITTPCPAKAASPCMMIGTTWSRATLPRRSWRARTLPSTTGATISRCEGLNASAMCISPPGVITFDEKPWWYFTSPEPW